MVINSIFYCSFANVLISHLFLKNSFGSLRGFAPLTALHLFHHTNFYYLSFPMSQLFTSGYPLQYSGLENFMDCIVHGVTKSQTQLSLSLFVQLSHQLSQGRGLQLKWTKHLLEGSHWGSLSSGALLSGYTVVFLGKRFLEQSKLLSIKADF